MKAVKLQQNHTKTNQNQDLNPLKRPGSTRATRVSGIFQEQMPNIHHYLYPSISSISNNVCNNYPGYNQYSININRSLSINKYQYNSNRRIGPIRRLVMTCCPLKTPVSSHRRSPRIKLELERFSLAISTRR